MYLYYKERNYKRSCNLSGNGLTREIDQFEHESVENPNNSQNIYMPINQLFQCDANSLLF